MKLIYKISVSSIIVICLGFVLYVICIGIWRQQPLGVIVTTAATTMLFSAIFGALVVNIVRLLTK